MRNTVKTPTLSTKEKVRNMLLAGREIGRKEQEKLNIQKLRNVISVLRKEGGKMNKIVTYQQGRVFTWKLETSK